MFRIFAISDVFNIVQKYETFIYKPKKISDFFQTLNHFYLKMSVFSGDFQYDTFLKVNERLSATTNPEKCRAA